MRDYINHLIGQVERKLEAAAFWVSSMPRGQEEFGYSLQECLIRRWWIFYDPVVAFDKILRKAYLPAIGLLFNSPSPLWRHFDSGHKSRYWDGMELNTRLAISFMAKNGVIKT